MQDLWLAFRALRATPVVTGVAILSLTLSIGANTAIFSLIDSLWIRMLPVKAPDRLVFVTNSAAAGIQSWSYPVWEQIRDRPQLFDGVVAWFATRFDLASGGETQFVNGLEVSGSFFDMLGVRPIVGRTFLNADDRRGGGPDGPVAIISYSFWQRRFGGSADAIGQTLSIDHVSVTIVGVTPREFVGPEVGRAFDVAVPLGAEPLFRLTYPAGHPIATASPPAGGPIRPRCRSATASCSRRPLNRPSRRCCWDHRFSSRKSSSY